MHHLTSALFSPSYSKYYMTHHTNVLHDCHHNLIVLKLIVLQGQIVKHIFKVWYVHNVV